MPHPIPSDIDTGLLFSVERLLQVCRRFSGTFEFPTSLGLEDQVLSHLVVEPDIAVDVVTLGTGRLFDETQGSWARSGTRHGLRALGQTAGFARTQDETYGMHLKDGRLVRAGA